MKGDEQLFWMIVVCLSGIFLGFLLADSGIQFDISELFSGVVVLFAAFFGSWFAFRFQRIHEIDNERHVNLSAGNRVILAILTHANTLKQFQRDIIDGCREHPLRAVAIWPVPPFDEVGKIFDLVSLEFLVPNKRHDILPDIIILEQKIKVAIAKINERSRFHRYEVQPLLATSGFSHGQSVSTSVEEIRALITEFNWAVLQGETDAMIALVDDALESCIGVKNKVRDALNEDFKGMTVLDFNF